MASTLESSGRYSNIRDSSVSTCYNGKLLYVVFKSAAQQPEMQFQWQWQIPHTILDTQNYACFTTVRPLMHH